MTNREQIVVVKKVFLQIVLKKENPAQVFSFEFFEISKNTFFTGHLWATASGGMIEKGIKLFFLSANLIQANFSFYILMIF